MTSTTEYAKLHGAESALKMEDLVRQLFPTDTHDTNYHANACCDIDFYDSLYQTFSVKWMQAAERSGNVAFELEVFINDEWELSWFHTGKAEYYLIVIGYIVYIVDKERLIAYQHKHGWDKVVEPSRQTLRNQVNHPHKSSRCGCISLDKLLTAMVAHPFGTLNKDEVDKLTELSPLHNTRYCPTDKPILRNTSDEKPTERKAPPILKPKQGGQVQTELVVLDRLVPLPKPRLR